MRITNGFCNNRRVTFKSVNVFEKVALPVTMRSSSQNNSQEKVVLKNSLPKDKFNISSEQQISKNEIIALAIALAAATATIGLGMAEIFKRPNSLDKVLS